MPNYFLKYTSVFTTTNFNKDNLPPHLFYYIHSGAKASTDIKLRNLISFVQSTFFDSEASLLKNTSIPDLKNKTLALHNNLIDKPERGYRELMVYVPFQAPPTDVADYLRKKYRDTDRDIEEKIKTILSFIEYTVTIAHEIIIDLVTENSKGLYQKLIGALMECIYKEAKANFPDVIKDTIDTATLDANPIVKRKLITLLHTHLQGKHIFQEIFKEAEQFLQTYQDLCEEYERRQAKEVHTQAILNADSTTRNIMLNFFREFQFVTVAPDEIADEMEKFFNMLAVKLSTPEDPFTIAAWVCMEYTRIHPKMNGNGRASRLLANIILAQHGIVPVIFDNDDEYTQKIRAANNNHEIFTQYLYEKALDSANLYFNNSASYNQQFQHFSSNDLTQLETVEKNRQSMANMGLIDTFRKERADYDPQFVLQKKQSTLSKELPPFKKTFTAVEQAASREYRVTHHYSLAKILFLDALELRKRAQSSNAALAILYVNLANCGDHLSDPVDEKISYLASAKNLIKSDPMQIGLLNTIEQKLGRHEEERQAALQTAMSNMDISTTNLTTANRLVP